jgi:hypothetical protein
MKNAKVDHAPLEAGIEPIKHVTMAKSLAMHASGHKPHAEVFGEHAAGHAIHDDHVEKMCGGGYMAKGKHK